MIERHFAFSTAIVFCLAASAFAEDAYYDLMIADLELVRQTPEKDEAEAASGSTHWRQRTGRVPYASLDGGGEAFLSLSGEAANWARLEDWKRDGRIAILAPQGQAPSGRLFLPDSDDTALVRFDFELPAEKTAPKADAKRAFHVAKQIHYRRLMERGIPGAAWFRHQWKAAGAQVNAQQGAAAEARGREQERFARENSLEDTFALFSGSRAVSENLQLDRDLRVGASGAGDLEVDKLEGISIKEIDWQPLIKDLHPELDPLAAAIPADQHVVFFPSFQALVAVADEISRQGTPLARFMESRSEDERLKERYERQLGLPLSLLARLLGGQVIDSVALTGSDPYFFAGTDVALVFEAKQPAVLKPLLLARIAAAVQGQAEVKAVQGEIAGIGYAGFVSPDRKVSSYVAEVGPTVVVTNSTTQLARLANVRQGQAAAIAGLPEYKFFRGRYPRGEGNESALVFLSDATIRRWCGPRWRIADSRRVRAASMLAELQAEQMDRLAVGKAAALYVDKPPAELGELRLSAGNVHSATMGSLAFMTPIAELQIDKATSAEADAYRAWRSQYQSNWRWAFDPITLRLTVEDQQLAADLSVMPLIWGSDYRNWVEAALGAEIKPGAGDPHDALAHFVTAVNAKSERLRQSESFVAGLVKVSLFDWLGESVAWYVDDDPLWRELAIAKTPQEASRFMERNFHRLPIALHCEVTNSAKLILFMAGVRGLLEQVAPEMTVWETLKHNDQPYVKIALSERGRGQFREAVELAIYYAFWSDGLVVTLNESVLKRALDRQSARQQAQAEGKQPSPPARPWLGSSMAMQFEGKAVAQLGRLIESDFQQTLQVRSWDNLPILNEWRRRYPDRDPVELHEAYWHTRLVCPGGGKYVWNDEWRTMESTVFGPPGQPKSPEVLPAPWQSLRGGNLGVTFEHEGLRAKAVLDREAP